ncbi:MAG TPA: AIR synthase-related protein, partial [Acidimicrobiales bacterium]|nr:AIR synthase-related protein [Acidimicrobiales bacterium]
PAWFGAGQWTLADELLRPSVIYTPAVLGVIEAVEVHAIAHITGGGLPGNVPRVIGAEVDAVFEAATWGVPRIFGEIQQAGDVAPDEMYRVFNMGLGMVLAVPAPEAPAAIDLLRGAGHEARAVGSLVPGSGAVRIV